MNLKKIKLIRTPTRQAKIKGLLAYDAPPHGAAMLFEDTNNIHMVGMKFPIDVVFLDHNHEVIDIVKAYPEDESISLPYAKHVLEMPLGQAYKMGIRKGTSLILGTEAIYYV